MSKKVRPGDYVELGSGEAGYVTDVEWRYTVIQDIFDNQVVIPNSRIVASAFKNYGLPQRNLTVDLRLGIAYGCDLRQVELVTLDVARELQNCCLHAFPGKAPFFLYESFSYFSVDCRIFVHAKNYLAGLRLRNELIKRLHERYKLEGIELAFPIAAAHLPDRARARKQTTPPISDGPL